ncbi:hypothetical protein D3C84_982880 [compost metagenome]
MRAASEDGALGVLDTGISLSAYGQDHERDLAASESWFPPPACTGFDNSRQVRD